MAAGSPAANPFHCLNSEPPAASPEIRWAPGVPGGEERAGRREAAMRMSVSQRESREQIWRPASDRERAGVDRGGHGDVRVRAAGVRRDIHM